MYVMTSLYQALSRCRSLLSVSARMTRGNQRDLAREKAAKKSKGKAQAASDQGANQGLTKEQR